MRMLKVYGWTGHRNECPGPHHQTREIVAASSQAEAARLSGHKRPAQMFNLCETGNEAEIAQAMREIRTVFWLPLNDSYRSGPHEWRKEAK